MSNVLVPLKVSCPGCGSQDVVYSCEPSCCFQHVCAACRTTFQTSSIEIGSVDSLPPIPFEPATDAPTVACAACESTAVFTLGEQLVCTACNTRLRLELIEVERANQESP